MVRCVLLVFCIVVWSVQGAIHRQKRDNHGAERVTVYQETTPVTGFIQYSKDGARIRSFLGIRYAKPPTGERRFSMPEKLDPTDQPVEALKHGARCPYRPIPTDPELDNVPTSEDCLFLDIYTPDRPENRPVMVFLHGGGFYGGSGALYNFKNVAARDVIVVSVSFRVDIFGFLSTQNSAIPGNFGILDAEMALHWVRENIAHFGGDPEAITLFGASSGAAMVSIMALTPRNNFRSAILQSGVALAPWAAYQNQNNPLKPRSLAAELGNALECQFDWYDGSYLTVDYDAVQLRECFMSKDVETLMNASIYLQEVTHAYHLGGMFWIPVLENEYGVLPGPPFDLLNNDANRPTIYGFTAQDGSWLLPEWLKPGMDMETFMGLLNQLLESYPAEQRGTIMQRALEVYLPMGEYHSAEERKVAMVEIMTDVFFKLPAVRQARLTPSTFKYMYQFDYLPSWEYWYPSWYGVGHASEKGFVLGLPNDTAGFSYPQATDVDHVVADHVVTLWTNFAKSGYTPTPTPVDGVTWPEFRVVDPNTEVEEILHIKENLQVGKLTGIQRRLKVWTDPIAPVVAGAALSRPFTFVLTLMTVTSAFMLTFHS